MNIDFHVSFCLYNDRWDVVYDRDSHDRDNEAKTVMIKTMKIKTVMLELL